MDEKSQNTSVNHAERTSAVDAERTVATPYFDAAAIRKAQPAVPLSEIQRARSWPTTALVAIAIVGGLAGGVIGGLLPAFYPRDTTAQRDASRQTPGADAIKEAGGSTEPAPSGGAVTEESSLPARDGADDDPVSERDSDQAAVPRETEAALNAALKEWLAATNARDIDRQMTFYNPVVEAFYRSRNTPRADVRADKERVFKRANLIDIRVGTPDIQLSPNGRTAVMRFHKRYTIEGGGEDRRGEVVQELRWQLIDGQWRIISERDLRVVR